MGKVTKIEEDSKFRFEIDRGRTMLVVVLGADYGRVRVRRPGEDFTVSYVEAIDEALRLLDTKTNYLILPKVNPHHDGSDNDIEVYEFFK